MSSLAESLDQFRYERTEIAMVASNNFNIDNDEKANRAVKKIIKEQENIKAAEQLAKDEIAKINAWLDTVKEKHQNNIANFEVKLYPYITKKLEGGKSKTDSLPPGKAT